MKPIAKVVLIVAACVGIPWYAVNHPGPDWLGAHLAARLGCPHAQTVLECHGSTVSPPPPAAGRTR